MGGTTTNFTNGSLVLRVWRFDGGCEMLAKFQYFTDAVAWARGREWHNDFFHIAVCEHENECRAFGIQKPEVADGGESK